MTLMCAGCDPIAAIIVLKSCNAGACVRECQRPRIPMRSTLKHLSTKSHLSSHVQPHFLFSHRHSGFLIQLLRRVRHAARRHQLVAHTYGPPPFRVAAGEHLCLPSAKPTVDHASAQWANTTKSAGTASLTTNIDPYESSSSTKPSGFLSCTVYLLQPSGTCTQCAIDQVPRRNSAARLDDKKLRSTSSTVAWRSSAARAARTHLICRRRCGDRRGLRCNVVAQALWKWDAGRWP